MKKFSKVNENNNNKEKEELKKGVDLTLRASLHKFFRDFLHIRTYGPIDPILEGTMRIEGKDEFISAVIDLFSNEEIVDSLSLLQEAKFSGIDNVINDLENKINEKQSKSETSKHDKRIDDIVRQSEGNVEKAKDLANRQADKIKSGEKAFYRGIAAERMGNSNVLKAISEIFIHRSKKLGFRK